MRNRANLKGLLNRFDQQYYINDYHPSVVNEKKRREREIFKWNKSLPDEDKSNITYEKGKLQIDGMNYAKPIREPRPDDILDLQEDQFDRIMSIPIEKGMKIVEQDSQFIAYTAAVQTYQQIQDLYTKMRIMHGGARHVVCAYNVPSNNIFTGIDGCDDQEPGAVKGIVNALKLGEITNRVFFVIRYCGSAKLGSKRFELYLNAAKEALRLNPENSVTGEMQIFSEPQSTISKIINTQQEKLLDEAKKAQKQRREELAQANPRGRGRGGGNWRRVSQSNLRGGRNRGSNNKIRGTYATTRKLSPGSRQHQYTSKKRRFELENAGTLDNYTDESGMEGVNSDRNEDWSTQNEGDWPKADQEGWNGEHSETG